MEQRVIRNRQNKKLYLPMGEEHANQLSLQARIAFETVRTGRPDKASALAMSSVVLLCETLTVSGHGLLPLAMLGETRQGITGVLMRGVESGRWEYPPALVDQLTDVVNEYDRQMHETRLNAIVAASDAVDRLIERSKSKQAGSP